MPEYCRRNLRQTPSYAPTSDSLVIASSVERSQAANVDDGFARLHELILAAAQSGVRGATSAETMRRVEHHKAVAKARTMRDKKFRAATKRARSGGSSVW